MYGRKTVLITGAAGGIGAAAVRAFLGEGYAVAATDLHSPVNAKAWVGESLKALEKAAGAKAFRELVESRPAGLLEGVIE